MLMKSDLLKKITPQAMQEAADHLVENWINGNRSVVYEELITLGVLAGLVLAEMAHKLSQTELADLKRNFRLALVDSNAVTTKSVKCLVELIDFRK
jgi:hypothetical protein